MTAHDARIGIARSVFAAWSSGDADAPEPYFTDDAVLSDTGSGRFEGWPAIRAFFAAGLTVWSDLLLAPDEYFTNPDGVAVHYWMSATITDPAMHGPDLVGRRWEVEVMSYLRFRGSQVCYEVDVHDRDARLKSLGLKPWLGVAPQRDPFHIR